ncbi:hypothetical protein HZB02_03265 [Candidatus Woesearchaeota archaeon]|nr:hypothetical protein [Candidatus Woesearchaeota archaeon]
MVNSLSSPVTRDLYSQPSWRQSSLRSSLGDPVRDIPPPNLRHGWLKRYKQLLAYGEAGDAPYGLPSRATKLTVVPPEAAALLHLILETASGDYLCNA